MININNNINNKIVLSKNANRGFKMMMQKLELNNWVKLRKFK